MVDEALAAEDSAEAAVGSEVKGMDADKLKVLEISIRDLLRLNEGSVVELDRLAGEPLDILINGTMIAKGEVVMVGERFGIRFSEIVDPEKRMESI